MSADTDGRLAEQLDAFRETARWRITNDGARLRLDEVLRLVKDSLPPGYVIPHHERDDFFRLVELAARHSKDDSESLDVRRGYMSELRELLAAAQRQPATERKAAERQRKAEEKLKKRLKLPTEDGGLDRYWRTD